MLISKNTEIYVKHSYNMGLNMTSAAELLTITQNYSNPPNTHPSSQPGGAHLDVQNSLDLHQDHTCKIEKQCLTWLSINKTIKIQTGGFKSES